MYTASLNPQTSQFMPFPPASPVPPAGSQTTEGQQRTAELQGRYKVLIVDDHAVVRRGLQQIVADEPEMWQAAEASNADQAIQLIRQGHWDAVVLDLTMPDKNGLDLLVEIKKDYPHLPCLMLSMHPEDQFALRALKLGASGYLTKETAPDELLNALRKVVSGGRYVSQTLAEKLAFPDTVERPRPDLLSEREFQVLKKIATGNTVSEIATQLDLSVKTVSTYRARVLSKMKMRNNAELTHYAIQHGLVEPM
jgi:two-component system, NarL family, invasion response regulator UvrY